MEVIYLQHHLTEYLENYNFMKIGDANSIFADVKSIMQLLHLHFFADVKSFELERLKQQQQQKQKLDGIHKTYPLPIQQMELPGVH